eukprot:GILI01004027.1.p1 GENE.GILI01004027.1~~GILI01004027.1.p1  ORF type:complete len:705 (-),score=179.80 GILI01004027.1:10-2091(-)
MEDLTCTLVSWDTLRCHFPPQYKYDIANQEKVSVDVDSQAFNTDCFDYRSSSFVGEITFRRSTRAVLAQAADAVTTLTVLASSPLITLIGDPTSIEVQALVVILRSDCASDAENEATKIVIYFISPFWSMGPKYIVIGHIIISAVVVIVQLLVGAFIKRQDESEYPDALKRGMFPAISHGITQILYMGSCYGTFELLLRGSAAIDIVIGIIGVIYILAVPVYTTVLIVRVIKPVKYLVYESFFKKRVPIRWFYPRGYYRAVCPIRPQEDIVDLDAKKSPVSGRSSPKSVTAAKVTDLDLIDDPQYSDTEPQTARSQDPNAVSVEQVTQNILLRGAFCTVSLFMTQPRRFFSIYGNIMCILLCLLVHVVPQELRCANRWLAISVVFFITAIMLFVVRPHRAIMASVWAGICYVFLGILTILETIGVLSPSINVQTMKVVVIVIIIILVLTRTAFSLYIWYVERQELQRLEAVTSEREEAAAIGDDAQSQRLSPRDKYIDNAPPVAAFDNESTESIVLESVEESVADAMLSLKGSLTDGSSGNRPTTVTVGFDGSDPKSQTGSIDESAVAADDSDDDAEVVFDAVESHHPSERASVATEDFDLNGGAANDDDESDEDFAAAAAAAWDDAIDHFGDDIDAAAQVLVPEIVAPRRDGLVGGEFSDSSRTQLSYSSAGTEDEGLRNVDEDDNGEAEYY